MDARSLYLDLLKTALTDTIHNQEPDHDDEDSTRLVMGFRNHYIRGRAHTMVPMVRLDNLQACVIDVLEEGVPGDFIETGVWRGGSCIFMRGILKAWGDTTRRVWVADSFEGLPEPDAERHPKEAEAHHGRLFKKTYNHFAVSMEDVQQNFRAYDLLDEQVRFLKGWFCDSLPNAPVEQLAIMRLDGDYYDSTMDALKALWPKLSVGGYAIIDDYGEDQWTNCRQAVDEFREANGITDPMVKVDSKCWYWQRTS